MHYHAELLMPPTDRPLKECVDQVFMPYSEHAEDSYTRARYGFFDWLTIGGRWNSAHELAKYDPERLEAFDRALQEKKVTVSPVRSGKPDLQPESQRPMVDALWREHFPETDEKFCPLVSPPGGQRRDEPEGAYHRLSEVPRSLSFERFILAGPGHKNELQAVEMLVREVYTGTSWVKTAWDGTLEGALAWVESELKRKPEAWRANHTPQDDWLLVTVDYHS